MIDSGVIDNVAVDLSLRFGHEKELFIKYIYIQNL